MMAEKKSERVGQGTFAKLYDVQEELTQRNVKPLGRPRKKIQRKPTTIHLTQSESRNLSRLQLAISEQFSVNRSELVGVAIEALSLILLENKHDSARTDSEIRDLEAFRKTIFDFIKS